MSLSWSPAAHRLHPNPCASRFPRSHRVPQPRLAIFVLPHRCVLRPLEYLALAMYVPRFDVGSTHGLAHSLVLAARPRSSLTRTIAAVSTTRGRSFPPSPRTPRVLPPPLPHSLPIGPFPSIWPAQQTHHASRYRCNVGSRSTSHGPRHACPAARTRLVPGPCPSMPDRAGIGDGGRSAWEEVEEG